MHSLTRIQRLPITVGDAWEFFSSPANLQKITPPDMGFHILTSLPENMYPGMIISYTVKPLFGISVKWVTEITHIQEPSYFIDTQLSGPYKIWHHQHFFKEIEGGVEMKDIVHYELPAGPLGRIVHALLVRKKVQEIFDFRKKVLEEKFGKYDDNEASGR